MMSCTPLEFTPLVFGKIGGALFFTILFIQSGFDKALNWKGNLEWINGYFANSPLQKATPVLLWILTFLEIGAGLFSALGVIMMFFCYCCNYIYLGAFMSGLSLLALFFGMRIAKDYSAAASLAGYFAAYMGWIVLLSF